MVTATAAVAGLHLTVDSPEPCPGVTVIGGRPVPNEGEFDLGTVPLRTAFARSCNTTFAQLGAQLPPDALPSAALRLGLGADYRVPGLTTVTGAVPPSTDTVQRAENGFGQGQVIATPLGMALAAATVARGANVVPQLIHGRPTEVLAAATPPDAPALDLDRWQLLEVRSAIPVIEAATVDQFVPQMLNYEVVGGVGFQKGCYPGQEVVARSQYRGTIKRRMFLFAVDAAAQASMAFRSRLLNACRSRTSSPSMVANSPSTRMSPASARASARRSSAARSAMAPRSTGDSVG